MAIERWVTVKTQQCEILGREVDLQERRVYPSQQIPDMERFRVLARRCTADVECNLLGCSCRWAYTGPAVDRFFLGS